MWTFSVSNEKTITNKVLTTPRNFKCIKEMGYKNSNVVKTKKLKIKNQIKETLKEMNFSEMEK